MRLVPHANRDEIKTHKGLYLDVRHAELLPDEYNTYVRPPPPPPTPVCGLK